MARRGGKRLRKGPLSRTTRPAQSHAIRREDVMGAIIVLVILSFLYLDMEPTGLTFTFLDEEGEEIGSHVLIQEETEDTIGVLRIQSPLESGFMLITGNISDPNVTIQEKNVHISRGLLNGSINVITAFETNPLATLPTTQRFRMPPQVNIHTAQFAYSNPAINITIRSQNGTTIIASPGAVDISRLINRSCTETFCETALTINHDPSFVFAIPPQIDIHDVAISYSSISKNLSPTLIPLCSSFPCDLPVRLVSSGGPFANINLVENISEVPLANQPPCPGGIRIGACGAKPFLCSPGGVLVSNCTACGCNPPRACISGQCVFVIAPCPVTGCLVEITSTQLLNPAVVFRGTTLNLSVLLTGPQVAFERPSYILEVRNSTGDLRFSDTPTLTVTCETSTQCNATLSALPITPDTAGLLRIAITNITTTLPQQLNFTIQVIDPTDTLAFVTPNAGDLAFEGVAPASFGGTSYIVASYRNSSVPGIGLVRAMVSVPGPESLNTTLHTLLDTLVPPDAELIRFRSHRLYLSTARPDLFGLATLPENTTQHTWVTNESIIAIAILSNLTSRHYTIPVCALPPPGVSAECPQPTEIIPIIDAYANKHTPAIDAALRTFGINLGAGTSLVGIPLLPGASNMSRSAFALNGTITALRSPFTEALFHFNSTLQDWNVFSNRGLASNIQNIETLTGYALTSNQSQRIIIRGLERSGPATRTLHQGFNIIALPRTSPCRGNVTIGSGQVIDLIETNVPCTLNNTFPELVNITTELGTIINSQEIQLGLNAPLEAGRGYFIKVTQNATISS
ncbi:hypothetical protein HY641_01420 [Candidatus Woesearchaeota archaeon]|nr:hypothetical protein [Candidatus Woesearchaeota archaeon]